MVASIGTAAVVAALVGPPLFHAHLLEAGHAENSPELVHIEMAYREASLLTLLVAVTVAVGCSLVVSWYLSRRIQEPLSALADAATGMAGGRYSMRVPVSGAGPELDAVSESFNSMAQRLEHTEDTRRRLLSDLGHEMRTPLSTIRAYLESIDDGVRSWDSETSGILRDQVERLTLLTTDIADVSAAEEGRISLDLVVVPVDDLLQSAADVVRESFRRSDVELIVRPSEPPSEMRADPHRLGQVLSNLLNNALRHSPPGSRVILDATFNHGTVVITVTDQGEGIPVGQLPHVFERFWRGDTARDRATRGSGIGLTISKAIVEAHGGTIRADSPGPGQGTVITFSLPRT